MHRILVLAVFSLAVVGCGPLPQGATCATGTVADAGPPAMAAAPADAGLVNGRRDGRCVYYRVDPHGMKPLINWMAHYRAFWTEHVDRLEKLLETLDE